MNLNSDTIDKVNELLQQDTSQLNIDNCDEALNKLYNKFKCLEETFIINLPNEYNDKREFSTSIKELKKLKEKLIFLRKEESSFKSLISKWKLGKNPEKYEQISEKILKNISIQRQVSYFECLKEIEHRRFIFSYLLLSIFLIILIELYLY
jgi:uncharacterized coiled-coil protein SlyX